VTILELRMNPYVDVHVHPEPVALPIDPASIEVITVRCPVRGRGLRIHELRRDSDPALFAFFGTMVADEGHADLDSDSDLVPALVDMGFLVTDADVVTHPRYSVPLPADVDAVAGPDWVVAPSVRVQPAFAQPPGLPWPVDFEEQEGRLDAFVGGPVLWVGDPAAIVGAAMASTIQLATGWSAATPTCSEPSACPRSRICRSSRRRPRRRARPRRRPRALPPE